MRIRGGGSKDFYGQQLAGELLDTRDLTGVLDYQPSELVVTVRAGTPLAELEALLAAHGQCLPFEPPHFALSGAGTGATVGGMVAAGLSGPSRASVGAVRDYVLGVELVNGRAELLRFGGQVMKNVAGYDLSRLMVGSLGTLGLLTEVSLKVSPLPAAQATLVFAVNQAGALAQLQRWLGQPLPLNASCWVHDPDAPGDGRDLLFVRLRGAHAAVRAASARMLQDLPGDLVDEAVAERDWQACRDLTLPFFASASLADGDMALWRLSLPQTTRVLNLAWPQMLEWHGALRWVWAPPDAAGALRDSVRNLGGHATVFLAPRGDSMNSVARFPPLEEPLLGIHRRLKQEFDPAGIFNPGRMAEGL